MLANLLDTRFHPSEPKPPCHGLTVEDVAVLLHCRSKTVLQMVREGKLHPFDDDRDGELYFNPEEIAIIAHIPI
jgi:hypothetical protein